MSIKVTNINKWFGNFQALNDVTLEIASGELVALLGPSGSGKTTLLRVIAGLEMSETGSVEFDGEDATERSAKDRKVGFVFQHYALFRHMTVFENIAFGLRVRPKSTRPSNSDINKKVSELLDLVQLGGYSKRYPSQLSGGQRQRIALARALAVEPRVLLLDEPFGALDAKVRIELRRWLKRLHEEIHVTSVFVTHDQEEALEVADRVVIMNHGKIEQIGTPDDVYEHPANPFVLNFLGSVNLFHGRSVDGHSQDGSKSESNPPMVGYVRPHELIIDRIKNGADSVSAVITEAIALGPNVRLDLIRKDNGATLEAHMPRERFMDLEIGKGDEVFVSAKNMKVFAETVDNSDTPLEYSI